MVTTLELRRRGLPYAVVVDGAATPASLADLDDKGLPYLVEVADGATMASRRALEARGLRYLVPVLVDATPASKASLAAQGLRYAVQVDADILPADRLVLQRQGLACYVEVDSSGNSVAAGGGAAVGGGALLEGEANGFATDFTYATDASRVALKAANTTTNYAVDAFYANAGTSPKMVYDAAGTLGWSPHNLIQNSEVIPAPIGGQCTITNDVATWPGGGATADRLRCNAGGDYHYCKHAAITSTVGTVFTYSQLVKRDTWDFLFFVMLDDAHLSVFSFITGAFTSLASGVTGSVDVLTNGWYRIKLTAAALSTTIQTGIGIAADASNFSFTAVGTEAALFGPAQCNLGSVPTAYLSTPTSVARVGLALDYDPVTHVARGLLCEPQATNLAKQSAGLLGTISPWDSSGGATYTASAQTDPAGGLAAIQVAVTSNTGNNYAQNISSLTNGAVYTASMWVKGTASQQIYFSANSSQNGAHNQLVTFTGAWQRVSSTVTVNATNAYLAFECYNRASPGSPLPNVTFHVWGAQFETGAATTSYIPTLAATVSRAADAPNAPTSAVSVFSATVGTFAFRATTPGDTGQRVVWQLDDGTANERFRVERNTSNEIHFITTDAGAGQVDINLGVVANSTDFTACIAWQANSFAASLNGAAAATDTSGTLPTVTSFKFGYSSTVGQEWNRYLQKFFYLPRRASDAEVASLQLRLAA